MKTMKIIDLLNKIANGEEVPRKIAYGDIHYVYVGSNRELIKYVNEERDFNEDSRYLMYIIDDLNDEVEILEEEKEIEKMNLHVDDWCTPTQCDIELSKKIDELIKENNKLKFKINQQDQIIREAREYVKSNIEFCENDSQGAYEKCNIRILSDKKLLEILDRNVNNE